MSTLIFLIFIVSTIYTGFKIPRVFKIKKEIQNKIKTKIKADNLKKKVKQVKKELDS